PTMGTSIYSQLLRPRIPLHLEKLPRVGKTRLCEFGTSRTVSVPSISDTQSPRYPDIAERCSISAIGDCVSLLRTRRPQRLVRKTGGHRPPLQGARPEFTAARSVRCWNFPSGG